MTAAPHNITLQQMAKAVEQAEAIERNGNTSMYVPEQCGFCGHPADHVGTVNNRQHYHCRNCGHLTTTERAPT